MKCERNTWKGILICCLSLPVLFAALALPTESLSFNVTTPATGQIAYPSVIDVTVNVNQIVAVNNLSLGLMIDWGWKSWTNNATHRQLVEDANFKMIRLFDFKPDSPSLMPCTHWEDAVNNRVWDWTNVNSFVKAIFDVGAEPLICLGGCMRIQDHIPPGMAMDPITKLPYPDSYAEYCVEWVKHFKEKGWPVRFYEILNEPPSYFGWTPNVTMLEYFRKLWNPCAKAMRTENPALLISFDFIMSKLVLNYWVANNGENVDFLDFHKYDCWALNGTGYFDDPNLFRRAELGGFETTDTYGVVDAQRIWLNARGVVLPVICSESNVNSACNENGTEPRTHSMAGAVWTALVLRKAILKGLSFYTYYNLYGSWGILDLDTGEPWYPCYVLRMIGDNLLVGDRIVASTTTSNNIRALAWIHNGTLNVLIISEVDQSVALNLQGIEGEWHVTKIDNTIPWKNATLQSDLLGYGKPLMLKGYTVALLQPIS